MITTQHTPRKLIGHGVLLASGLLTGATAALLMLLVVAATG